MNGFIEFGFHQHPQVFFDGTFSTSELSFVDFLIFFLAQILVPRKKVPIISVHFHICMAIFTQLAVEPPNSKNMLINLDLSLSRGYKEKMFETTTWRFFLYPGGFSNMALCFCQALRKKTKKKRNLFKSQQVQKFYTEYPGEYRKRSCYPKKMTTVYIKLNTYEILSTSG